MFCFQNYWEGMDKEIKKNNVKKKINIDFFKKKKTFLLGVRVRTLLKYKKTILSFVLYEPSIFP